jgi:single-stranded-DNA-specific exonuclease
VTNARPGTHDGAVDFLNVSSSFSGRRWVGPTDAQRRAADALAQATGLPSALAAVLARRGIDAAEAPGFLEPRLRDLLPDPRSLRDMETAATLFLGAVRKTRRIAVFADYDVDGGSAAALLLTWLRGMDRRATLYVPDRIDEGYGPNPQAMRALAETHDLIVCVDCGTLSHDAIAAAEGTDVIVLDHHLGGETLPPAAAVANPNRQDESGENRHLCAAGVVFLMLVEVRRQMRIAGMGDGPDLWSMLDLVALATVADVAPLIGINRAFVRQGLKVMSERNRPGLVALADIARLDAAPSAHHLGFLLGPRINAGGRVGQADLGARLLATADPAEAERLATALDRLNTERRAIEDAVRVEAMAQADARGHDAPLVWAAGDGWHPGVVGIVAARLKEATNRPAVVIGLDGGIGKGSGRSVAGIDLGAAVQRLAREGLLEKGGGHPMAAGLTVTRAQLEPAMARLATLLARQGADTLGAADLSLDGLLMPSAATPELIAELEKAGPFGAGAPAPRFAFADLQVRSAREVGTGHLRLDLAEPGGARIEAIAFGAVDGPLGPPLMRRDGAPVHVAGRLEINDWGGRRRVQLRLDDAAPSSQA